MKANFRSVMKSMIVVAVLVLSLSPVFGSPFNVYAQDVDTSTLEQAVIDATVSYFNIDPVQVIISQSEGEDVWVKGYVVVKASGVGGPDVMIFLAKWEVATWLIWLEGQPEYFMQIAQLPASLRTPDMMIATGENTAIEDFNPLGFTRLSAWDSQPELSLPWAAGETWKLTTGPHLNSSITTEPWSSLDFSPGTTGSWKVRASAGGTVVIIPNCNNYVQINHTNGWQTGYYHLTEISVSNGQSVSAGTYLGKTSALYGCGGSAKGAHVHFSLRKSGVKQAWTGRYIGGFNVLNGTVQGTGCLERISDKKKFCPGASFASSGAVGMGKPGTPALTSPNNVTVYGSTVNFAWTSTYGAIQYQIQVATDSAFVSVVASATPTATSSSISTLSSGQYYWRVRAENYSNNGDWSAVGSFNLQTDVPPTRFSMFLPCLIHGLQTDVPPTPPPPSPLIVNPALTPALGTVCASHWYKVSGAGYGGTNVYLTLNTNNSTNATNSAKWRPTIPQNGRYKVEAYIGHHGSITWSCPTKTVNGDTSDARYKIYYSGGSVTKVVNQLPLDNQWTDLGTYYFQAGTTGYVYLRDLNGETSLTRAVSFNVIRFTWVGP